MLRLFLFLLFTAALSLSSLQKPHPRFKVLALYASNVEPDHVLFAKDALAFFSKIATQDNFDFEATTDWNRLNNISASTYQLVLWLNESPQSAAQRSAFETYMRNGGAWMGFHAAGYNDKDTHWPWFVDFLGGVVFYTNSWPPLPAKLRVDVPAHPVTEHLPVTFSSPANEWYLWKPSPRLNKNVRVLVTLDASNYPIGFKDVLVGGDLPVVWTNTNYKMIYMNMGHGDKIFSDATQNRMIENAVLWLGTR